MGYTVGAEIGVSKGQFSRRICQCLKGGKLFAIDAWLAYPGYAERKGAIGQRTLDRHYAEALGRLAPFNCQVVRALSVEAAEQFAPASLDFVFIDGNHTFEYVVQDIATWEPKVRPGGMVCGHDYWNSAEGFGREQLPIEQFVKGLTELEKVKVCQGKDAIDAWTHTNFITPWYVTGDDDQSSWFYIKGEEPCQ